MTAIPFTAYTPELIILAGALLVFLFDTLGLRDRRTAGPLTVLVLVMAFVALLADLWVTGLGSFSTLPSSAYLASGTIVLASGPILISSLGLIFQAIFVGAALLVTFASLSDDSKDPGVPVFYGLVLLATLGMLLVAMTSDLIFLLLAVELTSLSTYVLVGYTRKDARALEAAMKFYIIGALSTALSFFGASLLYGAYYTTSLSTMAASTPDDGTLALVGFGLLAVGLGFKATVVPFHMWAVDVYDGAPDTVSAFLAAGSKKMGIFAYIAVFVAAVQIYTGTYAYALAIALGVLAVATMTLGNLLALQQQSMKRLLAYSSISQAGYILIGIAVDSPASLSGATIQVIAHVLMKGGAFLVVGAAASLGIGSRITDYKGLGYTYPGLAACFSIMLLSLAGIPLTLGFIGKFYLFGAAVEAGNFFILLAIAGLLNSAVSVFYYGRILRLMYSERPVTAPAATPRAAATPLAQSTKGTVNAPPAPTTNWLWNEIQRVGTARWSAIFVCALLLMVFGIDPTPLVTAINSAASHYWSLGI